MAAAAQIPVASQQVIEKAPTGAPVFTRPWYRFFGALSAFVAGSEDAPAQVVVGVSPFTYDMPSNGVLLINGGTVSAVEYGRGAVFTNVGTVAGLLSVNGGDQVRITYTVAPTVTLVRQ